MVPYIVGEVRRTAMPLYSAKVTSKGQITIPKGLRDELELKPGSTVTFETNGDGSVKMASPLQVLRSYFGTIPLPPGMTGTDLAAMGEEIWTREAIERYRRSMSE
jgi:AbrB family looped-hinge helix DNA binding protein